MNTADILKKWRSLQASAYKKYLEFWKTQKQREYSDLNSRIHKEAFRKIDCLSCANCCKTSPPILITEDIHRIAKSIGVTIKEFERRYILTDINGEKSFNKVPCHFLNEDNSCQIYDVRPQACRQFPHTDDTNFFKRPVLNAKNVMVCPAAFYIAEQWISEVNKAK